MEHTRTDSITIMQGWHRGWRRLMPRIACTAAIFAAGVANLTAAPRDVGGPRGLSTMSCNMYVGTDLQPILALDPADPDFGMKLLGAVSQAYYELIGSQPPVRIDRLAEEIATIRPDVIGLQEVSMVLRQAGGDSIYGGGVPADELVFDYLQLMLDSLEAHGASYEVASAAWQMDVEVPMLNLATFEIDDVRLIDRDVILVRSDLPPGHLRVSNPQRGGFDWIIGNPALGISVTRGWCSVDLFVRGQPLRIICTHLETEIAPQIQWLQGGELLDGPADTELPVIMLGDFNADPLQRNGTQTFDLLTGAGFTDAWNALNPGDPQGGLTFGHDAYLADPLQPMFWRLDLVLSRGAGFVPTQIDVVDPELEGPLPPLWPSDHASVVVDFLIERAPFVKSSR